jgi:hypothetical protein
VIIAGQIEMPLGPSPNLAMLVDAVSYLDQERYAAQGLAASIRSIAAAPQSSASIRRDAA